MFAGLNDIKRFTIAATDGDIGISKDFLFDDRAWTVRYLYADTHKWLPLGNKVLISPVSLQSIEKEAEKIHVNLTRQQVKDSPSIDEHKPVSRAYEELLFKYFGYGYYWTGPGAWGDYAHPTALAQTPAMPAEEELERIDETEHGNHLRSINELQGYDLKLSGNSAANDHKTARIEDLILDTENWEIPLIVVNTHTKEATEQQVFIAPKQIEAINWMEQNVRCGLDQQQLQHCPVVDHLHLNDRIYQKDVKQQLAML